MSVAGSAAQFTRTSVRSLPRAQVVDGAGDELLADAGLAQQQHRARGRADLLRARQNVVQRIALADDALRPLLEPEVLPEVDVLGLEPVAKLANLREGRAQLLLRPLALGDVAVGAAGAEEGAVGWRSPARTGARPSVALPPSGANLELQPLRRTASCLRLEMGLPTGAMLVDHHLLEQLRPGEELLHGVSSEGIDRKARCTRATRPGASSTRSPE